MVLNMDTELQRLICVSVEKMTREPGSGSRKERSLDLRKALLVAHVLQDMRTAYLRDDYEILANTVRAELSSEDNVEILKRTALRKVNDKCVAEDSRNPKKKRFLSDDWASGVVERPPRSDSIESPFMTSPYPSGTQSCLLTCSDATMSKISQITHPVPVSINTSYILSPGTKETDEHNDDEMDEDTPSVSEQVEVTSLNDVEESTTETVEIETVQCEDELNNGTESPKTAMDIQTTTVKPLSDVTNTQEKTPSILCPLPRKKRPLPKEFLGEDHSIEKCEIKRTRTEKYVTIPTVTSLSCDVTVTSSSGYLNTTTATTLTCSTALSTSPNSPTPQSGISRTSSSSTTTSSVCTVMLVSSSATNSRPRVVVELMNKQPTLWSWAPPPAPTQPQLSRLFVNGVTQMTNISSLRESSLLTGIKNLVAV